MSTYEADNIERAREANDGLAYERWWAEHQPDTEGEPDAGPSGDGVHGRYCVVAVYPLGHSGVLSRWDTSTMAAKIAERVAAHGGNFDFIGVTDDAEPERGWLERFDDKGGETQ